MCDRVSGNDEWVLGPGTATPTLFPCKRNVVSRQAHIVIYGGIVSGKWSVPDHEVRTTCMT